MTAIYALCEHGSAAEQAVEALRSAGLADRDIMVLSPEPREDCAFSHMHPSTRMWWCACAGALVGAVASTALVYRAETSWPIDVGGLPVVTWWSNLIVVFEITMLGAILATAVTFVVSAKLGGLSPGFYDTAVTEGRILVGVEQPRDAIVPAIRRALEQVGDVEVKVVVRR